MAVKYFCENSDCLNFRKTIIGVKTSYVMKENKLTLLNIPKCLLCGELLSYTEEKNETVNPINIGEFAGMTNSQRSEMLKNRALASNKKDGAQEKKEHYKKKAIKNFLGLK